MLCWVFVPNSEQPSRPVGAANFSPNRGKSFGQRRIAAFEGEPSVVLDSESLKSGKPSRSYKQKVVCDPSIWRVGRQCLGHCFGTSRRTVSALPPSRGPFNSICRPRPSRTTEQAEDATTLPAAAVRQHLGARRNLFSFSPLYGLLASSA